METKIIEKTLVAAHSFKTTLEKIGEAVGVVPEQIYNELQKQGLEPVGPQIWNYIGCDGKMETEFQLNVCVPVAKKGTDTEFVKFVELEEYNCVSHTFTGAWSEFAQVYDDLLGKMSKEGYELKWTNREVYHHCDFEDQSKCVTEIQIEVAS
ncbi:GyrI-like domain-containing protein [Carboxylicivirga sp. N1Y90]|uniref:GyrI-like domain-containing protein n=1 Tax=Carboxylicivirga fragile TaxID=3417571 RepID=UPI003D357B53|nr:GyrI-like domain-containing protein [Marinilabiliaceae bacterium N1Y90]